MSDEVNGKSMLVWPDRQWVNPVNNAAEPGPEKALDLAFKNTASNFIDIEQRVWFS